MAVKNKGEKVFPTWLDVAAVSDNTSIIEVMDSWPDIPDLQTLHREDAFDAHGRMIAHASHGVLPRSQVKYVRFTSNIPMYLMRGCLEWVFRFEGHNRWDVAVVRKDRGTTLYHRIHPDTKEPVLRGTMTINGRAVEMMLQEIDQAILQEMEA